MKVESYCIFLTWVVCATYLQVQTFHFEHFILIERLVVFAR